MKCNAVHVLIVVLLAAVVQVNGVVWRQGARTQLVITSSSPLAYSVYVNGLEWLSSSPVVIHCNNVTHTEQLGNLVYQAAESGNGTNQALGLYYYYALEYIAVDPVGKTPVIVSFTYFPDSNLFQFVTSFPEGAQGTAVEYPSRSTSLGESEFNSTSLVSTAFPAFIATPNSLLRSSQISFYEWHGRFSADSSTLGTGLNGYQGGTEGGPLLLFNSSLGVDRDNADAVIISGFSHFKDSIGSLNGNTSLSFGVQGYAQSLPAGFTIQFGLSSSQYGINAVVDTWGANLRKAFPVGKIDAAHDPVNNKLSYWTDNGAYYYGGYWSKYPNVTAESILLDLAQYWKANNIPIGSIQLDPWWYLTSGGAGACDSFSADTSLFPRGIDWLKSQIPIPFVLYSSYFTPTNSYASKFDFIVSHKFDVGWASGQVAVISPGQAAAFYNYIMDSQANALGGFEIDFMDFQYLLFDGMTTVVDSWRTFLDGSNQAALAHNVSIQYCMELPNDILQSVEFASVTSARASEDDFPTNPSRWAIAYTSMLHRAVGLGPFFDNFWTTTTQPGNPYDASEPNTDLATIISTLSAGPVGLGDGSGYTNVSKIMRAVRQDGVILKPSMPIIPIDTQFVPLSQNGVPKDSNIWATYSQVGSFINYYLLAVNLGSAYDLQLSYLWPRPANSTYWVAFYNTVYNNGETAAAAGLVKASSSSPFTIPQQQSSSSLLSFSFYSITPVLDNGWTVVGETAKLVAVSPLRVRSVSATGSGVTVQVTGAPNENIQFTFVSPAGSIVVKSIVLSAQGTGTITAQ